MKVPTEPRLARCLEDSFSGVRLSGSSPSLVPGLGFNQSKVVAMVDAAAAAAAHKLICEQNDLDL